MAGVKLEDLQAKARETGVDMEAMAAPNIASIAAGSAKQRRVSRKGGNESQAKSDNEATEDEDDDAEGGNEKEETAASGKSKQKWFDAETKCRRAERTWQSQVDALEKSLKDLKEECSKTIEDFRALGADGVQSFAEEMQILDRRMTWLQAIVDGDSQLQRLMDKQAEEEEKAKEDGRTTSQDLEALARVGPCKDYKELKSIAFLREQGSGFRACTSNDAIKELNDVCAKHKKMTGTLAGAVKAAKNDLVAAKKRQEAIKKKEEEKALKAEKAAAKANAKAGLDSKQGQGSLGTSGTVSRKKVSTQSLLLDTNSDLWQDVRYKVPVVSSLEGLAEPVSRPCILSGVALPQEVGKAVTQFGKVFAGSALRVTEGRAQTALGEQNSFLATEVFKQALPTGFFAQTPPGSCDGDQSANPLTPVMKVSCFGFAACSISSGRTELAMLPCLRLIQEGNLVMAILAPLIESFSENTMTSAQRLMTEGTADGVMKAAQDGELFVATVGQGDAVYIPPGAVCSHKALAADVLGLRMGLLGSAFKDRLQALLSKGTALPAAIRTTVEAASPIILKDPNQAGQGGHTDSPDGSGGLPQQSQLKNDAEKEKEKKEATEEQTEDLTETKESEKETQEPLQAAGSKPPPAIAEAGAAASPPKETQLAASKEEDSHNTMSGDLADPKSSSVEAGLKEKGRPEEAKADAEAPPIIPPQQPSASASPKEPAEPVSKRPKTGKGLDEEDKKKKPEIETTEAPHTAKKRKKDNEAAETAAKAKADKVVKAAKAKAEPQEEGRKRK